MSLVPFNTTGDWSIVLRDDDKKALVLYDPTLQTFSIVNDPVVFSRFRQADATNRNRCIVDGDDNGEDAVCSQCGQQVPDDRNSAQQHRAERRTGNVANSNSSVVRSVEYFRLLENAAVGEPVEQHFGISEAAFSQGYFDRFFVTQSTLGRGSRGAVYLVEHILDNVSLGLFALKKVPVGDDHEWLEKVLAEVHLLRLLSHPNLVSYNHVWLENSSISSFAPQVPCAFILQEYCDAGTLEDYIRQRVTSGLGQSKRDRLRRRQSSAQFSAPITTSQRLSLEEILLFMTDIVSGVVYLHQNRIIHRDLKPSNCLLNSSVNPLPTVLVSDFGEGQLEGTKRVETGATGTLEYCAPELITPRRGRLAQFSKKTDIFSLGMILHYLCFSKLPYASTVWDEMEDVAQLRAQILAFSGYTITDERNDLPSKLHELILDSLSLEPKNRPTGEDMLATLNELSGKGEPPIVEEEEDETSYQGDLALIRQSPLPAPPPVHPPYLQPNYLSLFTTVKWAVVAAELAAIYHMEPSKLAQTAAVLIGIQVPTTNLANLLKTVLGANNVRSHNRAVSKAA